MKATALRHGGRAACCTIVALLFSHTAPTSSAAMRDLLVTDYYNDVVKRYDGDTGAYISDYPNKYANAGMDSPRGIEFSADGSKFFVNSSRYTSNKILIFDAQTSYSAGTLVSNVSHEDLYLAPNGYLYATGTHSTNGSLYRYDPNTGAGGYLAAVSGGSSGVTMGPDGNLYIANFSNRTVKKYSPGGAYLGQVISGIGGNSIGAITFGPDGHIYVTGADSGVATSGQVYKYNGQTFAYIGKYATNTSVCTDIEFGPDGAMYVAASSSTDRVVRRIDPITGAASNFVAYASGGIFTAWNLAFSPGPIFGMPENVGGPEVRLNVVEILGGGAEATSLGSVHGLSAQSLGGIGPVTDNSTVRRNFTFDNGGSTDPIEVFLNGMLEGQLFSDNNGQARVIASLTIRDLGGNVLGTKTKNLSVHAPLGFQQDADVNELFGIAVTLTPGETYEMISYLEVYANGGATGAGRALFNNTFTAEFGPTLVPEPATLALSAAVIALRPWRRRRGG